MYHPVSPPHSQSTLGREKPLKSTLRTSREYSWILCQIEPPHSPSLVRPVGYRSQERQPEHFESAAGSLFANPRRITTESANHKTSSGAREPCAITKDRSTKNCSCLSDEKTEGERSGVESSAPTTAKWRNENI
jgi:hypothetical protein